MCISCMQYEAILYQDLSIHNFCIHGDPGTNPVLLPRDKYNLQVLVGLSLQ